MSWLGRAVLRADRGRCVHCGACDRLEVDHVRPRAAGGRTVPWNVAVLCRYENRVKSDYWHHKSGRVQYHPFPGLDNRKMAAAILAAERRARRNPARWIRMIKAMI